MENMSQVIARSDPRRHRVPQGVGQGITAPIIVKTYESDTDFEVGAAHMSEDGYRIVRKQPEHQLDMQWRVTYELVATATPEQILPENPAQQQSDFTRLLSRYNRLAWSSSASEQRERASLEPSLISLYRALYPETNYSYGDDFDMVARSVWA
jgi:hypothetical protein